MDVRQRRTRRRHIVIPVHRIKSVLKFARVLAATSWCIVHPSTLLLAYLWFCFIDGRAKLELSRSDTARLSQTATPLKLRKRIVKRNASNVMSQELKMFVVWCITSSAWQTHLADQSRKHFSTSCPCQVRIACYLNM